MKRLFVALPVLLCFAGVASSQSLVDLAEKERERREENAKQGNKTAVEAEGIGSFGHVWWRGVEVEDVTPATGAAPSAKSDSDSEATPTKTTTKDGTKFKRGELSLRGKSSRRP